MKKNMSSILDTIKSIFVGKSDDNDPFAYHKNIPVNDDDGDDEEEEEEEDFEEEEEQPRRRWETEKEFADFVYGEARNFSKLCDDKPLEYGDFYFNMVSTVERDRGTRKPVKVWWLPRDHPYVEMIVEENLQYLEQYQQLRFPSFASYLSMVVYMDYVVEEAIKSCIIICKNNGLHVDYQQESPPPPPPPTLAEEEEEEEQQQQQVPMIRMKENVNNNTNNNNNNNKKDD